MCHGPSLKRLLWLVFPRSVIKDDELRMEGLHDRGAGDHGHEHRGEGSDNKGLVHGGEGGLGFDRGGYFLYYDRYCQAKRDLFTRMLVQKLRAGSLES